jgi:hypothetical protein
MHRLIAAAMVMAASAAAGCATLNVGSQLRHGTSFAAYRTFDWGPADALPTGDPRLDADSSFKDHMTGAVERGLAAHGMQLAAPGETPDLLVHYHANVTRRIDVNRADRQYGYCYDEDCAVTVADYEAGTLVVDMVDTRTNRVVWRGWAQRSLDGVIDHPDRLEQVVERAVAKMLAEFPRGR